MTRLVDRDTLAAFIETALGAVGMKAGNAARMAELMAEADLGGQAATGCFACRNTSGASGPSA